MRVPVQPDTPWLPIAMFLAVAAALFLAMDVRLAPYDEAIILVGAQEVLSGKLPHRDFYANYGPATFYTLAALFWAVGPSFLAERLLDTLWRAGCVVMAFAIVRRHTSRGPALLVGGIAAAWMWSVKFYAYPNFACLFLILLQVWLLTGRLSGLRLALIGALTGYAFWIRYDVGAFVGLSHAISLVLLALRKSDSEAYLDVTFGRAIGCYGAGLILAVAPLAIYFGLSDLIPAAASDVLGHTLSNYSDARGLPFPGPARLLDDPDQLAIYLPFFATAVGGILLLIRFRQLEMSLFTLCALLLPIVALMTLKGVVRVSIVHMMLAILPATVLAGALTEARSHRAFRLAAGAVVALSLMTGMLHAARRTLEMIPLASDRLLAGRSLSHITAEEVAPGDASPYWLSEDEVCTRNYLAKNTRPKDFILVGNGRHDKAFANRISLYFTAQRRPATHWYHFDPGVQTRRDIQAQIVNDLSARHVRWVVRDRSFDDINEPNSSAISSSIMLLDRYIDSNFKPVAACGSISIHARRKEANG